MIIRKELEFEGKPLIVEIGKMAKQANGAAYVQYADTAVLVTAVANPEPSEGLDFFPLTVEYREKAYAAGKIPGGFIKREGKPSEKEILSARLIDRPIRPLFPENFKNETQVAVTVLSSDQENDADVLGTLGASIALCISDIPFEGPIASVRIGRMNGQFIINPTFSQLEESDMELVMAGSRDSIIMVEGEAKEISEDELVQALEVGHKSIQKLLDLQEEIIKEMNPIKMEVPEPEYPEGLLEKAEEMVFPKIREAVKIQDKKERNTRIREITKEAIETFVEEYPECDTIIKNLVHDLEKKEVRRMIIEENVRLDGRGMDDIRPITCEVGILPRTHGSALFTRGQTQSLGTVTLGTKVDEQMIDALEGESYKSYMLHYNFPPFSTGEVRPFRGPGRREIGHGHLAERALKRVIPSEESFPYTIRIVSEILESNGSSSMATVCSGSLALMDAGVPVKCHVAGIAMGLIKEGEEVRILTDILGDEDHLGDMDFKVAGTREGITAIQMDIKISGITFEILSTALGKARIARNKILDIMEQTIEKPRAELSRYAPRILTLTIPAEKIGLVIGPAGRTIKGIIEETGVKIDIEDGTGFTIISCPDMENAQKAKQMIEQLIAEPEVGKIYEGEVKRITNFGAFVEFMPGKEGLVHISEVDTRHIKNVNDILKVGDKIRVLLKQVDKEGRFNLSRKAVLEKENNKKKS
jgi:polyribonucleotide nucleotidyltransferase